MSMWRATTKKHHGLSPIQSYQHTRFKHIKHTSKCMKHCENAKGLRFREREKCLGGERAGFCRERTKKNEIRNRIGSIYRKCVSMDRESAKKLSRQILNSSMDRRCVKICREKEVQGSLWIALCRELLRSYRAWYKQVFQRGEKHTKECNKARYSTKDPNNILIFQKHLSTRRM